MLCWPLYFFFWLHNVQLRFSKNFISPKIAFSAISYAYFYNLKKKFRVDDRNVSYTSFEINGVSRKLMTKFEIHFAKLFLKTALLLNKML